VSATPLTGTLVLADLTGYTAYLSRGEIEHAPVIAGDLLETVVGRLEPPFRLSKLEGDAAFLFVEDGRADAALQLDAIEAAYVAFRRRLRSIDAATACDCASCQLAPRLDLKLFVHHGTYVLSRIAGREELAGPDVILAHRLLKGAAAATRGAGFAQFTAAAAGALGLQGPNGLEHVTEIFEHVGQTDTVIVDLDARWTVDQGRRQLRIPPDEAFLDVEAILPASPADCWAHLTAPGLRARWEGPIAITETSPAGRRGIGTTMECVAAKLASLEEVVDWQPFEHVAWRLRFGSIGPIEATADLAPDGDRTRLSLRWGWPPGATDDRLAAVADERRAAIGRLAAMLATPAP
jgi:hypothetical protein